MERELCRENMAKKWKMMGDLLYWGIKFHGRTRKFLMKFFEEIDLEKIKMDEADWYHCLRRNDYNYGGLSIQERLLIRQKIDKNYN
jgi:hypothetical protein